MGTGNTRDSGYVVHWSSGGKPTRVDGFESAMKAINAIFPTAKPGDSTSFAGYVQRCLVSDGEIPVAEIFWERK